MDTTHGPTQPTDEEARAALRQAELNAVREPHDARVHALATAGFGVAVGLFVALSEIVGESRWSILVWALYLFALAGLATWQTVAARSAPRHSKVTGYAAMAVTLLLAMIGIAVLNAWGHDATPSLWLAGLVALVVAAPMLVAGWLIGRR